jgi:Lsr2
MAAITSLVDDFDKANDIVTTEGVETVSFAYKGKSYEVDLKPDNQKELDELLGQYIEVGREVSSAKAASGSKRARSLTRTRTADTDTQKIREWAAANGHDVSKRGRISDEVRQAYLAANPSAPTSQEAAAATA